jgi:hypothetical protein
MKKINVISSHKSKNFVRLKSKYPVSLYEKKNGDWVLYLSKKLCKELNIKDTVNIIAKDNMIIIEPIKANK